MYTRNDPAETYYQTMFKNLLCILPFAVVFIYVTQVFILVLKHYLTAKLIVFFNSITLLFNCLVEEGEAVRLFETQPEIENIQVDECKTTNSCSSITVDKKIDSFSNLLVSSRKFDDSASDIEILRGDSDEEKDNEKEEELEEIIEVKSALMRNKRQKLCNGALIMLDLSKGVSTFDAKHSINLPIPKFFKTKSESPITIAEEIDIHQFPSPPASPIQNPIPFIPGDEESCYFSNDDMQRAIQASLDDLVAKHSLTSPREHSSTAKLPGQPSTEADNNTSASSSSKVNQQQLPPPVIQQEDGKNVVEEDFMEGDKYVGDKGKRPKSGKYAYEKGRKSSKSKPEE